MEGKIKWYDTEKGYGFIDCGDIEYFVHKSAIASGTSLNENDLVTFDAVQTERGWQAHNVALKKDDATDTEKPADDESDESSDSDE